MFLQSLKDSPPPPSLRRIRVEDLSKCIKYIVSVNFRLSKLNYYHTFLAADGNRKKSLSLFSFDIFSNIVTTLLLHT